VRRKATSCLGCTFRKSAYLFLKVSYFQSSTTLEIELSPQPECTPAGLCFLLEALSPRTYRSALRGVIWILNPARVTLRRTHDRLMRRCVCHHRSPLLDKGPKVNFRTDLDSGGAPVDTPICLWPGQRHLPWGCQGGLRARSFEPSATFLTLLFF